MGYEKKYKEALEGIEEILSSGQDSIKMSRLKLRLQGIFPELKESEDERLRKGLTDFLKGKFENCCSPTPSKKVLAGWIAWLEKQGEQKPINDTDENIVETVKNTSVLDMIEPKFKDGDWITNGDYLWQVTAVETLDYILKSTDGNIVDDTISHVDEHFHLWSIEDAKDGDVLAVPLYPEGDWIGIFKERNIGGFSSYCYINGNEDFCEGFPAHDCKGIHPATKEQHDLLFSRMKEAGYRWDDKRKEIYKVIIDEGKSEMDRNFIEMMLKGEQHPAWSEEDERHYLKCLDLLIEKTESISIEEIHKEWSPTIDWLKSLKDRTLPQPKQEWSEEDLICIGYLADFVDKTGDDFYGKNKPNVVKFIRSFANLPKPAEWSEEDEEMIQETIDWFERKCFPYALENENPARESIKWLKSLKERINRNHAQAGNVKK